MKSKEFNDYDKACAFCEKVNGQIQWTVYKTKRYWIVWWSAKYKGDEDA